MPDADARVEWLVVVADPAAWRSIGLTVTGTGFVPLIGTSLQLVDPGADAARGRTSGIAAWALSGIDPATEIDGLPTDVVEPASPAFALHPNGASGLDHVVVTTGDLERTSAAIDAATGCELKRVREVGTMRQGFHRIGRGGLIAELVERPELADTPSEFWGLVMNVDDLDAACAEIGEGRITPPKDAVQPGRRIATVDRAVGLGLPVALMTP